MTERPPRLYRLSRLFRRLSILAAVLIIVYVVTTAYSASQIRPGQGSSRGGGFTWTPGGSAVLSTSVNLTNRGWYALQDFQVETSVSFPNGSLVAHGGSPGTDVPPGSTTAVPVTITIPFALAGGATVLLTHDAKLAALAFVNATYASIFGIHLQIANNESWGAPFFGLNATVGNATVQGNGSVTAPVRVTFQNHASFADQGTLTFTVRSAGGAVCVTDSFVVDVPAGGPFDTTHTEVLGSGCNPHGGTLAGSYSTQVATVPLPSEALP